MSNDTTTTPPDAVPTAAAASEPERKRAVLYLRVSTEEQARVGGEAEGYSIPAQREAGWRKASELGADVVDEYLDRGESARLADRPALQLMLDRIRTEADIDYVIVHKLNRFARNRADDANMTVLIHKYGAKLVSCSENIDDTPSGKLVQGVLAAINEYESSNLGTEVRKGLTKKVQMGGTPGKAKIGYRNVTLLRDGNRYNTVEVDEERAEHIRWAFTTFARGSLSVTELTEALEERGLRSIGTKNRPSQPLYKSSIAKMLRDRYYIGIVTFKGIEYPGKHEPLIDEATFDAVLDILDQRLGARELTRKHRSYLKGSIFCRRCGNRLIFSRNRGRTGVTYDYFSCMARQHGNCDLPYLPVEEVDAAIETYYQQFSLPPSIAAKISQRLDSDIASLQKDTAKQAKQAAATVTRLTQRRQKLLDAYLAEAIALDQFKPEQAAINREVAAARRAIETQQTHWTSLTRACQDVLYLCQHLGDAYQRADDTTRRKLNQGIFTKLYVDTHGIAGAELTTPFSAILADDLIEQLTNPTPTAPDSERKTPTANAVGVSKWLQVVGAEGLEPPTLSV